MIINLTKNQENFKKVMSNFVTGVIVVTTFDSHNKLHGVTINSFNSVSLNPLLILYSLGIENKNLNLFLNCEKFAINILSNKQKKLSDFFANTIKNEQEFTNYFIKDEVPILNNTLGYLICKPWNKIEAGDHYVIISEVLKATYHLQNNPQPLIYFNRNYYDIGNIINE